ncbi:MAG: hypothetical protein Q8R08_01660 [bacterium]|nr:hypothetical protein [bacterium]
METIAQQIQYLRAEIAMRDSQLMAGVLVLAALIVASYIAAAVTEKPNLYKLPILLLVTGVFFVARQDHLEHRIVPWINMVEKATESKTVETASVIPSWEKYHASLRSRMLFLLPIDLLCALAFFWIFIDSARALIKANDASFVWWSGAGLVVALASVFIGLWAADK